MTTVNDAVRGIAGMLAIAGLVTACAGTGPGRSDAGDAPDLGPDSTVPPDGAEEDLAERDSGPGSDSADAGIEDAGEGSGRGGFVELDGLPESCRGYRWATRPSELSVAFEPCAGGPTECRQLVVDWPLPSNQLRTGKALVGHTVGGSLAFERGRRREPYQLLVYDTSADQVAHAMEYPEATIPGCAAGSGGGHHFDGDQAVFSVVGLETTFTHAWFRVRGGAVVERASYDSASGGEQGFAPITAVPGGRIFGRTILGQRHALLAEEVEWLPPGGEGAVAVAVDAVVYTDRLASPRRVMEWKVGDGVSTLLESDEVEFGEVRFDGRRLGWVEYRGPNSGDPAFERRTIVVADLSDVRAGAASSFSLELGPGGRQGNWLLSNGWMVTAETEEGGQLTAVEVETGEVYGLDAPEGASFSPLLSVGPGGRVGTGYRTGGTFGRTQTIWILERHGLSPRTRTR
ncbi:MAG: hypothetical protein AAGH15_02280 [Myxococcota bacterium]